MSYTSPPRQQRVAHKRSRRHQAGIGLLEVLIATAIFVVGVVAALRLFPEALRQLQTANERTVSSELAESELGRVRVSTAEALFSRNFFAAGSAVDAIYATGDVYNGYTTVATPMRGGESTFLQRVTFNVQMPDGRQETYVTYVSKQ